MKKKIHFITQAKGGSGKSVLAFMLAEKYRDAVILDLDDATAARPAAIAPETTKKPTIPTSIQNTFRPSPQIFFRCS